MSVNSQYLQAVIKYLTVVEEAEVESTEFKGMQAYELKCPFCTQYVRTEEAKSRKTAKLFQVKPNSWVFQCTRGFSDECRGGIRSFHNFLLFLHPGLFREYQESLNIATVSKK